MTNIEKKFSDITEIFSSDGYIFLKLRSEIERFEVEADNGDEGAKELVDIFNKFHKLAMVLTK